MKKVVLLITLYVMCRHTKMKILHKTIIFLLTFHTTILFCQDSLQTSDILEIHNGKKYKAIFDGDIISVHLSKKINGDTCYYQIVKGAFTLFKHPNYTT